MSEAEHPQGAEGSLDISGGIGAARFRTSMRHYPAGVTIVTLRSGDGPVGFTATSFASLSMTPPLVSFNISDTSSSLSALLDADSVVIHFLGAHQHELAQRFSRPAQHRFSDRALWATLDTGEPVLHGTPLWLHTRIHRLIPIGDHTLVIGLVIEVNDETGHQPAPAPLLYYNGRYHRPTALEQ
ncbi:flavin reductase family protein [Nocardia callitridis]|uniref:Flavin reductase family protein n=1 Tax=Nocardia callitridis TaxID=648753 RepID=A0ABP9K2H3_9NOCA